MMAAAMSSAAALAVMIGPSCRGGDYSPPGEAVALSRDYRVTAGIAFYPTLFSQGCAAKKGWDWKASLPQLSAQRNKMLCSSCRSHLCRNIHALLYGICNGVISRLISIVSVKVAFVVVADLALNHTGCHGCTAAPTSAADSLTLGRTEIFSSCKVLHGLAKQIFCAKVPVLTQSDL